MTLLLLLAVYLIATHRRPISANPDRLLALLWFVLFGTYLIFEDRLVPVTTTFPAYLFFFLASFAASFHLFRIFGRSLPTLRPPKVLPSRGVILTLAVIGLVPIVLATRVAASNSVFSPMDFRLLTSGGSVETGRESIGIGIAFPLACAGWYLARRQAYSALTWLSGVLVFVLSVLSTSKVFIALFLIFLVPWWRLTSNFKRWALVASAMGLALFVIAHLALQKFSADPELGLFGALARTFEIYALGGIAGFQLVLHGDTIVPQGAMWGPIGKLLHGLVHVPDSPVLPWTQIGDYYTNVYGAFGYWYEAFGFVSSILMGIILGSIYGLLFTRETTPSIARGFLRTFYLFPLLFLFHQDFFLPSALLHIGFLLAGLLLSWVNIADTRRTSRVVSRA